MKIHSDFFCQDAVDCARQLIGSTFIWRGCGGLLVETEAYRAVGDPACHTFFRKSAREFVEKHEPGTAYVYLNYGVHWLFNILTIDAREQATGFVLFRAIYPQHGITPMTTRRKGTSPRNLCSGPGKLTQALGINGSLHGRMILRQNSLKFQLPTQPPPVHADGRIGISRAQDFPWRFTSADHQDWTSRPYRET